MLLVGKKGVGSIVQKSRKTLKRRRKSSASCLESNARRIYTPVQNAGRSHSAVLPRFYDNPWVHHRRHTKLLFGHRTVTLKQCMYYEYKNIFIFENTIIILYDIIGNKYLILLIKSNKQVKYIIKC